LCATEMSERERNRELDPSDEYGGCSRETKVQRRDGGEQPGGGFIVEVSEMWKMELTHCDGGLFGSMYVSQVPGVAAGCDDDPDEVYLAYMRREERCELGLYMEEDKGDGEYVYEPPAVQHDQNAWLDRHLATQAKLRREGVLFDLQRALGRDTVIQREALRRRKEEEEREAEAQREEERKRAKQAKKNAKEAAKRAKTTWEHDDYAEGRKSMYVLLLCLKTGEGANAKELYGIEVLTRWIFMHVRDHRFDYKEELVYRLEDFALPNLQIMDLDLRWWWDSAEVYDLLIERINCGAKFWQRDGEALAVLRLLECAKRKGWLQYVADWFAQNALRYELVEKASKYELFKMFYEAMERPYGGPLWTLSTKSRKNMALFSDMRLDGMKEKWPRANHAIRILEVLYERDPQWLHHLAEHAADVERGRKARRAEYHLWAMSPVECELAEW
jgi:hypothetical protein